MKKEVAIIYHDENGTSKVHSVVAADDALWIVRELRQQCEVSNDFYTLETYNPKKH